jgi:post-segregation antitoxin (ccd killing protein)
MSTKKVTAKRVDVPMDADLLAEAKKYDVNIEEATREHFHKVKEDILESKQKED